MVHQKCTAQRFLLLRQLVVDRLHLVECRFVKPAQVNRWHRVQKPLRMQESKQDSLFPIRRDMFVGGEVSICRRKQSIEVTFL